MALPRPLLAPVMIASLPSSFFALMTTAVIPSDRRLAKVSRYRLRNEGSDPRRPVGGPGLQEVAGRVPSRGVTLDSVNKSNMAMEYGNGVASNGNGVASNKMAMGSHLNN